jgi:hypothetical protein
MTSAFGLAGLNPPVVWSKGGLGARTMPKSEARHLVVYDLGPTKVATCEVCTRAPL